MLCLTKNNIVNQPRFPKVDGAGHGGGAVYDFERLQRSRINDLYIVILSQGRRTSNLMEKKFTEIRRGCGFTFLRSIFRGLVNGEERAADRGCPQTAGVGCNAVPERGGTAARRAAASDSGGYVTSRAADERKPL